MQLEYIKLDSHLNNHELHYASAEAAGVDLLACIPAALTLLAGETHLVPSGIAIVLPPSTMAMICPRSGLGHKHGIILGNSVGIVDADYRGQIFISLWNRSSTPYTIQPYDRVAQLIVVPIVRAQWVAVEQLPTTIRGDGGFGSTGS